MTPPTRGGGTTQNLAHAYYQACVERDEARAEVERLEDALHHILTLMGDNYVLDANTVSAIGFTCFEALDHS